MNRFSLFCMIAFLALAGCSTVDKARRLLPFQESQEEKQLREQGITPDEERRVSILLFEQSLSVDTDMAGTSIVLPPEYVNSGWMQTGAFPSHAPQHLTGARAFELAWKKSLGQKSDNKGWVMAPPVIAGKNMYLMDSRGTIRAVSLGDGETLWKRKLKSILREVEEQDRAGRFSGGFRGLVDQLRNSRSEGYGGGLAVSGGVLYVTSGFGYAMALDIKTGDQIWLSQTPTPLHGAPAIADGRLFVVSQDDELFAFSTETGEILWTFQGIVEPARILSSSAPAIYGEIVVAPFASGELGALRVQNGRGIWNGALTRSSGLTSLSELNDIAASPVIFDNAVYAISHSGVLVAIDLRNGQRLWSRQIGGIHMPWIAGDTIFVMTSEGQLAALSRADGKVIWVREMRKFKKMKKRKKRIAWAGPVLVSDHLVLVSSAGDVVQVSPQNGETIKELKFSDKFFIAPIVANGMIYLISDDAKVYALQ